MFARPQGAEDEPDVVGKRDGDRDDVDLGVGEQSSRVHIGLGCAEGLRRGVRLFLIGSQNRGQLDAGKALDGWHVRDAGPTSCGASADDT